MGGNVVFTLWRQSNNQERLRLLDIKWIIAVADSELRAERSERIHNDKQWYIERRKQRKYTVGIWDFSFWPWRKYINIGRSG
jgi:hypothetical protein